MYKQIRLNNSLLRTQSIFCKSFLSKGYRSGSLTSHTPHQPHSEPYLQTQLQQFKNEDRFAMIAVLPKGLRLQGADVTNDLSYGSIPLYPQESLANLTDEERDVMRCSGLARIADFQLIADTRCIQSKTKRGYPVYYVHDQRTTMTNLKSVDHVFYEAMVSLSLS